jgi:beta-1,4-mannosyl-glycoprotein beta-1,4-N-acetylglucosaminyltransferase
MDEQKILKKIHAISDVENLSSFKTISTKDIQKKIASGIDLYDRGTKLNNKERHSIPPSVVNILGKYLPNCTK